MAGNYRDDLLHKELSYKVVGVLFNVYNELGYGYQEKYYQKAIERSLDLQGIKYQKQVPFKLIFKGKAIGRYYLDFLIEDKIVLELKVGKRFAKADFDQVKGYLQATKKDLAILVNFTPKGVNYLRVVNLSTGMETKSAELNLSKFRKFLN
ncbi:MAG: GxxExxY protein [Candidatus Parcubacteria bacterium]|nr:GxxExxY protein [Candidatus Parcubacteria bacterium]